MYTHSGDVAGPCGRELEEIGAREVASVLERGMDIRRGALSPSLSPCLFLSATPAPAPTSVAAPSSLYHLLSLHFRSHLALKRGKNSQITGDASAVPMCKAKVLSVYKSLHS